MSIIPSSMMCENKKDLIESIYVKKIVMYERLFMKIVENNQLQKF